MSCSQCQAIDSFFDLKTARKQLKKYLKKGPDKTTGMLIEALKGQGIEQLTVLDIGGGIGAIQLELLAAGAGKTTNVDASSGYQTVAREQAEKNNYVDKLQFLCGDFIEIAPQVDNHDIVTLDRVICCYPDMPELVGASAGRANRFYGVVFPRDNFFAKLLFRIENFGLWLVRNPFRAFIHPTAAVEAVLSAAGWRRHYYGKTLFWQVILYRR